MMIRRLLVNTAIVLLATPALSWAGTQGGGISGLGVLLNAVILLVIIGCFGAALKIFSLLRGGELASGWQYLAISFMVLCLAQLLELVSTLELFSLDRAFAAAVRMIGLVMALWSIVRIKKVLS